MKQLILVSIFLLASVAGEGQDLLTVLERNGDALGTDARKAMPALQTKGHAIMNGTDAKMPFRMLQTRPDRVRIETTVFGFRAIQTYNGATAWALSPTKGMEALKTDARDMEFIAAATAIDGPFSYNKDDKYVLKYLGEDTYRDVPVEKVSWSSKQERLLYYIDNRTWLVEGIRYEYKKNGGWYSMEYRVDAYHDFEGAKFPSEITAFVNGVEMVKLYVTDLKVVDEVEEEMFGKPSYTQ